MPVAGPARRKEEEMSSDRGAARAYDRVLRELDDIERQSPLERFMAAHEPWKERQGD
jgi:hypothetical protein